MNAQPPKSSRMPSHPPLKPKNNGRPCPGTIELQYSSKQPISSQGNGVTSSWPQRSWDKARTPGRRKLTQLPNSSIFFASTWNTRMRCMRNSPPWTPRGYGIVSSIGRWKVLFLPLHRSISPRLEGIWLLRLHYWEMLSCGNLLRVLCCPITLCIRFLKKLDCPREWFNLLPTAQDQVESICNTVFSHRDFAGLHYTGSTGVFKKLWKDIANNVDVYRSYPRIVGETGGKDFHLYHSSADVRNGVVQALRGAFEYQGQKCSALSRAYIARSLWEEKGFKKLLLEEVAKIKVGNPLEWGNFMGPVMLPSWWSILIQTQRIFWEGKQVSWTCQGWWIRNYSWRQRFLMFGFLIVADGSEGYFVHPTVVVTKDPKSKLMIEEIFAPILTVCTMPRF